MSDTPNSEKLIQVQNVFIARVEEAFRTAGLQVGSSEYAQHVMENVPKALRAIVIDLAEMGVSVVNIPRHWIPLPGLLGETIHEYLVEGLRAFAGGLHGGLKSAKGMEAAALEQRIDAAAKSVEAEMKKLVRLVGSGVNYVPDGCPHFPAYNRKGDSGPKAIERGVAIAMGARRACGWCYSHFGGEEGTKVTTPQPTTTGAAGASPPHAHNDHAEHAAEGLLGLFAMIGRYIKRREGEEKKELHHVLNDGERWLRKGKAKLVAKRAKANERRTEIEKQSTGLGWFLTGAAVFIAFVLITFVYVSHHVQ